MDKAKTLLFIKRYKAVEEIEKRELQNTSQKVKFLQLTEILRLSNKLMAVFPIKNKKEKEVMRRWIKIKNILSH